jgi:formamidopyrimidine-DNA glycosylase
MPELPDVEVFRGYLERTALHQEIADLKVDDPRVVEGEGPAFLAEHLRGQEFSGARRHGKHLFGRVGNAGWLAFHFGMTGYLDYHRRAADDPGYSHAVIRFTNGYRLSFVDRRKLGHLAWVADLDAYLQELGLGRDALEPGLGPAAFRALANGRRGQVKCWLMDQAVLAGLGNVYSDELLFQAGLHPKTPVADLDGRQLGRLLACLRRVLEDAVAAGAEPGRLPADFLVPRRRRGAACPRCGGAVETLKACGRTAYCCPQCQPA